MKKRIISLLIIIIGVVLLLDGFGSILIYSEQPWFPDHTVRLARALIGVTLVFIGWKFK